MNVNLKEEIQKRLSDVIGDVKFSNILLEEGKEILCSRKMQGVQTKLLQLLAIAHSLSDDIHVVETTNSEQPEN